MVTEPFEEAGPHGPGRLEPSGLITSGAHQFVELGQPGQRALDFGGGDREGDRAAERGRDRVQCAVQVQQCRPVGSAGLAPGAVHRMAAASRSRRLLHQLSMAISLQPKVQVNL
jgi:hypothetical protein